MYGSVKLLRCAVLCCVLQTPLHLAVDAGAVDIVKLLLAAGANPNLLDFDGASPLHLVGHTAAPPAVARMHIYALALGTCCRQLSVMETGH
jgi:ankyrin repeat protein